jgi:hypothetical protein
MRIWLIALMALVSATSHATAQTADDLRGLTPGSLAKVRLGSGEIIQGKLLRLRIDTTLIAVDSGARKIPVSSMDSLWVRGNYLGKGTIIGAIAGGALGAAFGIVAARGSCDLPTCSADGYFLLAGAGALIVGLPGALAGSLVGSLTPRWVLRFP